MALKGAEAHKRRLKALTSPKAVRLIGGALMEAAEEVKSHAQHSITAGSMTGDHHVPSRPGEPPNNDTGVLKGGIIAEPTGPLTAEVSSNAEYASDLEFGTSNMEARPYMAPARDAKRKRVQELVQNTLNHIAKTGG